MNILVIHQYFLERDDGGGSRFNELSRMWAAEGNHVTVLAGMVHYYTGKKRERYVGKYTVTDSYEPNIVVVRCHVSEAYNVNFLGRLWAYFSFVVSSTFAGLFRTPTKPDVIVVTSPPLFVGITGLILGLTKRRPVVFEVRDLWPESAIDTGVLTNSLLIKFARWFERFVYKRSNLVNVLTPAFRDRLIDKGVPREKIILIPNAADFTMAEAVLTDFDRDEYRKSRGWESDELVIIYVGAHGVANDLTQVIAAAERLSGRSGARFVLVGTGMEKPKLIAMAQEAQLRNVDFVDTVPKEEVFKLIAASDVGASILKKLDTFKTVYSNKTFDYMACRRPVLMAIDGVSRELVLEAGCGIYAEPENTDAFLQAVQEFERMSTGERDRKGEAGFQFAKKHFDRNELAMEYLDHLTRVSQ